MVWVVISGLICTKFPCLIAVCFLYLEAKLFVVKIAVSILLLISQPQNNFAKEQFVSSATVYNESSDELVQKGNQLDGLAPFSIVLFSFNLTRNA